MGVCEGTELLTALPQQVSLLILAAHFQFLLKDAGLGIRRGIILQAEDSETLGKAIDLAEQLGAEVITRQNQMLRPYPNDRAVLIPFLRVHREEKLEEFLARRDVIPVVAVGGVLPGFLRGSGEIVRVADAKVDDGHEEEVEEHWHFLGYAHEHPNLIYDWFRQFRTSLRYGDLSEMSRIRISLEAAAYASCGFFRKAHGEKEAKHRMLRLRECAAWMCQAADNGEDEMDVIRDVQRCLFRFLDEHGEVKVAALTQAGNMFRNAADAENAVLYDSHYYFIPERLMREACKPILQAVSFLRLKEALLESGCLTCNRTDIQNYTVKKLLWTCRGEAIRPRFLKMDRLMLDDTDQLTLEERSGEDVLGENCRQVMRNQ